MHEKQSFQQPWKEKPIITDPTNLGKEEKDDLPIISWHYRHLHF